LQNDDNGGSGFSAWSISNTNNAGQYVETSSDPCSNNPLFGDIRTGGKTWASYANPNANNFCDLYRKLNSDLTAGWSISARIAVAFRSGNKGIELINNANSSLYNLNIGSDQYTINVTNMTGWSYSSTSIFILSGRQINANTYRGSVRRGSDIQADTTDRTGVIRGIHLYHSNTNADCGSNMFYNDLRVYYTG